MILPRVPVDQDEREIEESRESYREWLAGPRARPLVVDAKVSSARGAWWLEEAFRGH